MVEKKLRDSASEDSEKKQWLGVGLWKDVLKATRDRDLCKEF